MKDASRWKRKVFFFIDRLQIPRSERRVLPLLMLASLAAWSAALLVRHPQVIDPAAFEEEQRRFREVYRASFERHAEIMDRYALDEDWRQEGEVDPTLGAEPGVLGSTVVARQAEGSARPYPGTSDTAKAKSPLAKVELNSAGINELVTLPGVGPAIASRILDWRNQHGRFTSVEQLLEVRGIGDATLARIRPFVRIGPEAPQRPPSELPPPPKPTPPPSPPPTPPLHADTHSLG